MAPLRDGEEVGPFTVIGPLPELGGLAGGAFGSVKLGTGADDGDVVMKRAHERAGGRSTTVGFDRHRPNVAYCAEDARPEAQHLTLGPSHAAEVLRSEAGLMERARGVVLPRLLGYFVVDDAPPTLVMERLRGGRPETWEDVARVLESLARARESGYLDHHGDLKPEHIFLDDEHATVRLIDPAPRLDAPFGAFTPEYNPFGLAGPAADVYALAVILYELVARVAPFPFAERPVVPFTRFASPDDPSGLDRPPPVERGQVRPYRFETTAWRRVTRFVDDVLGADVDDLPVWASDHRCAFERLTGLGPQGRWERTTDASEVRTLRSGVVAERTVAADGTWSVLLETDDGTLPVVRVEGPAAWLTWGPLGADGAVDPGDECAYTPSIVCAAADGDRVVEALDRLPYYVDTSAVPRLGSATFWCGHLVSGELVLTDTTRARVRGVDDRGHGPVMPLESLNRHLHRIRVEADFGLSGIWEDTPGPAFQTSMDLNDLPIGAALVTRVEAWTDHYESQRARSDYPPEWSFGTAREESAFITEGGELTVALQHELGPGWLVSYTPLSPRFD